MSRLILFATNLLLIPLGVGMVNYIQVRVEPISLQGGRILLHMLAITGVEVVMSMVSILKM
jgi:hypothetical protein